MEIERARRLALEIQAEEEHQRKLKEGRERKKKQEEEKLARKKAAEEQDVSFYLDEVYFMKQHKKDQ